MICRVHLLTFVMSTDFILFFFYFCLKFMKQRSEREWYDECFRNFIIESFILYLKLSKFMCAIKKKSFVCSLEGMLKNSHLIFFFCMNFIMTRSLFSQFFSQAKFQTENELIKKKLWIFKTLTCPVLWHS